MGFPSGALKAVSLGQFPLAAFVIVVEVKWFRVKYPYCSLSHKLKYINAISAICLLIYNYIILKSIV